MVPLERRSQICVVVLDSLLLLSIENRAFAVAAEELEVAHSGKVLWSQVGSAQTTDRPLGEKLGAHSPGLAPERRANQKLTRTRIMAETD